VSELKLRPIGKSLGKTRLVDGERAERKAKALGATKAPSRGKGIREKLGGGNTKNVPRQGRRKAIEQEKRARGRTLLGKFNFPEKRKAPYN